MGDVTFWRHYVARGDQQEIKISFACLVLLASMPVKPI